ncbi:catechol 2,3-dioxygenase-like lactoylglutathione lyase family enzyme [Rhizobium leguminosarum]
MNDISQSRQVAAAPDKVRSLPGHATVGTNDLDAASVFYDKLLAVFGIGRVLVQPNRAIYYGHRTLEFGIIKPFDGRPATVGNGGMIAFEAPSRSKSTKPMQLHWRQVARTKGLLVRVARMVRVLTAPIFAIPKATSF